MADPIRVVRTVTFVLAGVAVALCCIGFAWKGDALTGAFALNASQTAFDEAVRAAAPEGSRVSIESVGERSGALVLRLADADLPDDEVERLQDLVWEHYVRAFAGGGYAVSHVAVAPFVDRAGTQDGDAVHDGEGAALGDDLRAVDVRAIVARTGLAAPALHPLYADAGVFDPSGGEPVPDLPAALPR